MKIVTFDGLYEVVTDETPQGFHVLLMPVNGWLGNGYILDGYPTFKEAYAVLRRIVETYASFITQGYRLEQNSNGPCFTHSDGRTILLLEDEPALPTRQA